MIHAAPIKNKHTEARSNGAKRNMSQNNPQNNLDIWLSRLSHLSQFGLFALTIGALYYTVIPLYKTAALEESIARREAELSEMNIKLEVATAAFEIIKSEIYERNRKDLIEGIISVSPYCSGLMKLPGETSNSKHKELGYYLLKIDAAKCLRDELESRAANSILNTMDYITLESAVESASRNLSHVQKKALMDIETLPERAANDPSVLAPLGPYSKEAEEFSEYIESIVPGTVNKRAKIESALASTRNKISMDYVTSVHNEILKLRDIKWPTDR